MLAVAQKDGVASEPVRIDIDWSKKEGVSVDPAKPATWSRSHDFSTTKESYEFLARMKKFSATAPGCRVTVGDVRWIDVTSDGKVELSHSQIESILDCIRGIVKRRSGGLECSSAPFPVRSETPRLGCSKH